MHALKLAQHMVTGCRRERMHPNTHAPAQTCAQKGQAVAKCAIDEALAYNLGRVWGGTSPQRAHHAGSPAACRESCSGFSLRMLNALCRVGGSARDASSRLPRQHPAAALTFQSGQRTRTYKTSRLTIHALPQPRLDRRQCKLDRVQSKSGPAEPNQGRNRVEPKTGLVEHARGWAEPDTHLASSAESGFTRDLVAPDQSLVDPALDLVELDRNLIDPNRNVVERIPSVGRCDLCLAEAMWVESKSNVVEDGDHVQTLPDPSLGARDPQLVSLPTS